MDEEQFKEAAVLQAKSFFMPNKDTRNVIIMLVIVGLAFYCAGYVIGQNNEVVQTCGFYLSKMGYNSNQIVIINLTDNSTSYIDVPKE